MSGVPVVKALLWCPACNAYVLPQLLWNCADLQRRGRFPLKSAGWAAVNATLTLFRDIEPPDNRMCAFCWRDLIEKLEQPAHEAQWAAIYAARDQIAHHRTLRARGLA